ncbi:hypothetical protein E2C01_006594 [Portunus trituberculatus]|uniref:Uncharacterized protein n=1 Tax=Portunus trituberculatus TaxID=210409 RepID=A0A5B7CZY6_PORTR|nr:hypothetical protein [Portunus trituberculatus]
MFRDKAVRKLLHVFMSYINARYSRNTVIASPSTSCSGGEEKKHVLKQEMKVNWSVSAPKCVDEKGRPGGGGLPSDTTAKPLDSSRVRFRDPVPHQTSWVQDLSTFGCVSAGLPPRRDEMYVTYCLETIVQSSLVHFAERAVGFISHGKK